MVMSKKESSVGSNSCAFDCNELGENYIKFFSMEIDSRGIDSTIPKKYIYIQFYYIFFFFFFFFLKIKIKDQ